MENIDQSPEQLKRIKRAETNRRLLKDAIMQSPEKYFAERGAIRSARINLELSLQSMCPNITLMAYALRKNLMGCTKSPDEYRLAHAIIKDFQLDPTAVQDIRN